eukprot:364911-Chlamydomonas_euryale.AAC.4
MKETQADLTCIAVQRPLWREWLATKQLFPVRNHQPRSAVDAGLGLADGSFLDSCDFAAEDRMFFFWTVVILRQRFACYLFWTVGILRQRIACYRDRYKVIQTPTVAVWRKGRGPTNAETAPSNPRSQRTMHRLAGQHGPRSSTGLRKQRRSTRGTVKEAFHAWDS